MSTKLPLIVSIVIPCYNASETIQRTLDSLGGPHSFGYEVIVVDDGSSRPLTRESLRWGGNAPLCLLNMERNVGKAAACNAGFARTEGDVVIVLDADDELTQDWGERMERLYAAWPFTSPLAFAWAVTDTGTSTGTGSGLYSREQWLNGEGGGEYLPVFRGDAARTRGYLTPGCRKICGTLSYGRLLQEGPLYIHPEPMRIYHTETAGSLTKHPFHPRKAYDSYVCFHAAREAIENYDRTKGTTGPYLSGLYFREVVYQIYGQSRLRGLRFAWQNRRQLGVRRLGLLVGLSLIPAGLCAKLLRLAKEKGIVRSFG